MYAGGIDQEEILSDISRRDFIKRMFLAAVTVAAGSIILPQRLAVWAEQIALKAKKKIPDLVVLHGKDYRKLIQKGFEDFGGIGNFIKKGSYVVIKPNASWSRTPEQAANTNPVLVSELIKLCRQAGASKVVAIDHSCDNYKSSFKINGVAHAVKEAGGEMISLGAADSFAHVALPKAKKLKNAAIAKQILEADCFINMPIAKVHSAATLTMAMKNYMGVVKDRWAFHSQGLHQCIADISSFVTPDLVIMDCTRILVTNGPKGPGEVKVLDKVVFGTNHVSVDALGATYFGFKPDDIKYIKIAAEMGIGNPNLEELKIVKRDV